MLIGNDDIVRVRPRPEFHATEFRIEVSLVRGQRWMYQEMISWREFELATFPDLLLDRFFRKADSTIKTALNS